MESILSTKSLSDVSSNIEEFCIKYIEDHIKENKLEHVEYTSEFSKGLSLGVKVGVIGTYNYLNGIELYKNLNQLDLFN